MTIISHGTITRNIRPTTNKDYSNNIYYTANPRPLKLYRRGRINNINELTRNYVTKQTMLEAMDGPGQVSSGATCSGVPIITKIVDSTKYCKANKALNLIRGRTTMSKQYSQNYYQYLQKRCNTYDQKNYNFLVESDTNDKPGAPITLYNTYRPNCFACSKVIYKPSNYKFANQGAVSSSLLTYAKQVETNAFNQQKSCIQL
jgi:hypothetical protein